MSYPNPWLSLAQQLDALQARGLSASESVGHPCGTQATGTSAGSDQKLRGHKKPPSNFAAEAVALKGAVLDKFCQKN